MRILRTASELGRVLEKARRQKKSIGFVPTMGALHEGHLSLVRLAQKENDLVVVSIFINPLQFGPKEDFKRYPRNLARDTSLLQKQNTDFLFVPSVKEFYPPDFQTTVRVNEVSRPLCGPSRPGHFAGVATVVLKLLNSVRPDCLYLGQKDYQQFRVIEKMVEDLALPVQVRLAPIVREKDGLAMSSRNVYLSAEERRQAPVIYQALQRAESLIRAGGRDAASIKKAMRQSLKKAPKLRRDYLEIVDAKTLRPMLKLQGPSKALIAYAGFLGKTRLIDNILVSV